VVVHTYTPYPPAIKLASKLSADVCWNWEVPGLCMARGLGYRGVTGKRDVAGGGKSQRTSCLDSRDRELGSRSADLMLIKLRGVNTGPLIILW
jgi:hypothetical protein